MHFPSTSSCNGRKSMREGREVKVCTPARLHDNAFRNHSETAARADDDVLNPRACVGAKTL